jgi:hypothetical protein
LARSEAQYGTVSVSGAACAGAAALIPLTSAASTSTALRAKFRVNPTVSMPKVITTRERRQQLLMNASAHFISTL